MSLAQYVRAYSSSVARTAVGMVQPSFDFRQLLAGETRCETSPCRITCFKPHDSAPKCDGCGLTGTAVRRQNRAVPCFRRLYCIKIQY